MTKKEFETATTIHSKMLQYKRLSDLLKEAIKSSRITSVQFRVSRGSPIEFADNGLDFYSLLTKLQEGLECLYEENKEEFKKL